MQDHRYVIYRLEEVAAADTTEAAELALRTLAEDEADFDEGAAAHGFVAVDCGDGTAPGTWTKFWFDGEPLVEVGQQIPGEVGDPRD